MAQFLGGLASNCVQQENLWVILPEIASSVAAVDTSGMPRGKRKNDGGEAEAVNCMITICGQCVYATSENVDGKYRGILCRLSR